MSAATKFNSLLTQAKEVRASFGRGLLSQMGDILSLRFGAGKLGAAEYYDYRLFDLPAQRRREFLGWRIEDVLEDTLIDDYSRIVSIDKLTYYSMMQGLGFRIPRIHAIYHPAGRPFAGVPTLRDAADVERFLMDGMEYPFFGKPAYGGYGQGAASVESIDRTTSRLILGGGQEVEAAEFATNVPDRGGMGYVFQERLRVHPEIRKRSGSGVAGLRLMVLLRPAGPQLFRAVWKITSGANITDNFSHGGSGNMLGSIALDSGLVTSAVAGTGLGQREVAQHPETGESLLGFRIPLWDEVVAECLRAAPAFPGFLVQGWDVVVTEDGPLLLELNMVGCADLHQIADHRGLRDEVFNAFVRELGLDENLRGPNWPRVRNPKTGRFGKRQAHWPY